MVREPRGTVRYYWYAASLTEAGLCRVGADGVHVDQAITIRNLHNGDKIQCLERFRYDFMQLEPSRWW
jgi:hypothetical protein